MLNNIVVNFLSLETLKKSLPKILAFDSFRDGITDRCKNPNQRQINLESAKRDGILKEAFSRLRFLETFNHSKIKIFGLHEASCRGILKLKIRKVFNSVVTFRILVERISLVEASERK